MQGLNQFLFDSFKKGLLNTDPVTFCEENLTLDGKPFRINNNGYKPFSDIYRYIGVTALEPNSKPVVLVKSRQIGATTMCSALECFFGASGVFGTANRPPMRVMHCFPHAEWAQIYTKTKLNAMIVGAKKDSANKGKTSVIESKLDKSAPSNDSMSYKQFVNGNHIQIEGTGLTGDRLRGRQLCLETELPTPKGFIKLKDLKEGDELFDENGQICRVTKLHPIQESPESYRITFDDDTVVDACAEHLWVTYTKRDRINISKGKKVEPKIKNTKEILDTLKSDKWGENNHSVPNCLPVQYPEKSLLIDPYLFGLWLGDGNRAAQIETADPEILSKFECHVIKSSINHIGSFSLSPSKSRSYRIKDLSTNLRKLSLVYNPCPSKRDVEDGYYHKYIPEDYMYASFEQRLALLQGLMDSDGTIYKDGRCEFVQVRERLAYDVYYLVLSLGIKAKIRPRKSFRYEVQYKDRFRITFSTDLPVFGLKRKLERIRQQTQFKVKQRFIKSIEPIAPKPMRCITVDSPSHLYLITRQYIPTHNTIDCLFIDECQDTTGTALSNITKSLTTAKYGDKGIKVFFGTPKQKGSEFWGLWQSASQQYYYLGCEGCDKYFPLYTPGTNDWENIWIEDSLPEDHKSHGYIVKCIHCGFEQDKRDASERGKWIDINPEKNAKYIGFHLNMLYMPFFTRQDILNEKPENHPINTERAYQNEVLGEFYSGDSSPISLDELITNCGDTNRAMRSRISPSENKLVFLGVDWGKKIDVDQLAELDRGRIHQGQSFSSVVILSVEKTNPNILNLEFTDLLKSNDPDYKKLYIDEVMRRYSVTLAVGDIGYANDLTYKLQQEHGDKYLASMAVGNIKNHVQFIDDVFPKEIRFEKDYFLSEIFEILKKGRIRLPLKQYDRMSFFLQQCTSMEIKHKMDRGGNIKINYSKGVLPNDSLMSALNAYLAYKFHITSGFNLTHPNSIDKRKNNGKPDKMISVYLPEMSPGKRGNLNRFGSR